MIKNPNKYRLLRVFEYMLQTDEEHPLNVTQIQNKLAEDGFCDKLPDRKSILRDLACINDCGYEIEVCENHNCGKYMNGKQKVFEGYQLKMLADAVTSARFLSADDARKLGDAIMTLGTESDKELLKRAVIRDESLNVATKQAKYNFDRILEAIRERKQISFQYNDKYLAKPAQEDLRNDGLTYYISPYYLVPAKNDYYVIACTGEYKNFSHYRVSRMINVKETELAAKDIKLNDTYKKLVAEGKSISDYLREHINMWFGDTQRVNLHCRQQTRLDVLGTFGNLLNINDCEGNKEYFTTSVQVQAGGGFFNWVAGMGGNVIITGPECVREAYKEYLQEQLKLYK
ncbi:helix-turn-helix transcriptional regulator [Phascolarctobacterium succinatutens]|jgi:predicted DNA-binding transcriptional regulator YafY|uniref:helix-turn-helix transcriptional regulator n=1 Tax=Phascolarctobacterium succinatutens TaxID=626940 RepID=UPI0026E970D9|nr:WYL domain-containing protein [Phascolarctobacterium succinatutens]